MKYKIPRYVSKEKWYVEIPLTEQEYKEYSRVRNEYAKWENRLNTQASKIFEEKK